MTIQKVTSKDSFAQWQDKNNITAQSVGDIKRLLNRGTTGSYSAGVGLQIQVTSVDGNGKITAIGIGSGGSGASATPVLTGGKVTSYTTLVGGSGYVAPPYVLINGGGTSFEAVAQLSSGSVSSISIIDQGYGYETGTTFTLVGPAGKGYRKYDVFEIRTSDNRKALVRIDGVDVNGAVTSVLLISTETGFTAGYYSAERSIISELMKMEESKFNRSGDVLTGALDVQANFSVSGGTSSFSGLATFNGGLTVADGTTFTANGNISLGNAVGDSLTVYAGAWAFNNPISIAVASTVSFDTNVLVIDATNNRIGINKTSPTVALDSVGDALVTAGSNILSLTSASGLAITANTGITGTFSASGDSNFTTATDASSSTVGGLKTAGGLAVAKKAYVGTNLVVGTDSTSPIVQGSATASGTLTLKSTSNATKATAGILMTDGIASTSTATGTLVITGGTGISGALYVGGNVNFAGTGNTLGTITSGTWNGGIIGSSYGGLGSNWGALSGYVKFASGTSSNITSIPSADIAATLSSKTLDNTNSITVKDNSFTLQNATTTTKQAIFDLSGITAANTRTLTVPDATGTLVLNSNTQTLSNKTLDNTSVLTIKDSNLTIQDDVDTTKQAKFQLSSIATGTIRTYTLQDSDGTIALTSGLGATGTWNISISGNSATVTNGVVTTGSYADPTWITSLAKSKVGLGSVENTALSTWAGSTSITTLGTISSGTWAGSVISSAKGGLGLDFSASTGYVKFTSGVSSTATSIPSADIATALSNKTLTSCTIATGLTVPTGTKITLVDAPFSDSDAANKIYVDTKTAGFQVKLNVKGATLASLSATYNNAAGTLTATSNGAFPTIDAVSYTAFDRILVKDQNGGSTTPPSDIGNGIYVLTTVGDGSNPWVLTRSTDADSNGELNNALVIVTNGSLNGGISYLNTTSPVTLGTTTLKFEPAGSSMGAGNGIVKNGSALDVVGTANRIVVNADSIDIGLDVATLSGVETFSGQKTFSQPVKFGTVNSKYSGTLTTAATAQTNMDSFAAATYRTAKYVIQAVDGNNVHVSELLVVKDGANNVYVTEYGTVQSANLYSITADYDGTTNIRLRVTPASVNSTVFKFSCELITL